MHIWLLNFEFASDFVSGLWKVTEFQLMLGVLCIFLKSDMNQKSLGFLTVITAYFHILCKHI